MGTRHTRRTASVIAVVPIVVAITAGLAAAPTASPPSDTPPPDVSDFRCPERPRIDAGDGALPAGAVAVRLCGGGFQPPTEPLTTGVDELVDLVNGLDQEPTDHACDLDGETSYVLAFRYADRSVQQAVGCGYLYVAGGVRSSDRPPHDRFVELLRAQRSTATPPADPGIRPTCGTATRRPPTAVTSTVDEAVSAVLCTHYNRVTEHDPQEVAVPAADLATLLADRARALPPPSTDPDCPSPDTPSVGLVGVTAWGDRVTTSIVCDRWVPDGAGDVLALGPAARAVAERLVREAGRPQPDLDARSSATEVLAAYIDLLNTGERARARALWAPRTHPRLPTPHATVTYAEQSVRHARWMSSVWDATFVTVRWRVVRADGSASDTYVMTYLLGRDEERRFRIHGVSIRDRWQSQPYAVDPRTSPW